jgi:UDP-glucose 4-epimerase
VGDLVRLIGQELGTELEVELDAARVRPARSGVQLLLSSPARAEQLTGWRPTVELQDGLARTIEWVQRNSHRFKPTEYVI